MYMYNIKISSLVTEANSTTIDSIKLRLFFSHTYHRSQFDIYSKTPRAMKAV